MRKNKLYYYGKQTHRKLFNSIAVLLKIYVMSFRYVQCVKKKGADEKLYISTTKNSN